MNIHTRPTRLGLVLAALAVSGVALAASAHFVRGPTSSIDNDGNLTVSWKEAGLGDSAMVEYEASADGHARYQCVNRGGKCPSASNKQEVFGPVSASGAFASGKNGSITASLTMEPPPSTLQCPGNQVVALAAVSYSDIALADLTNGIYVQSNPSSVSQSGTECP